MKVVGTIINDILNHSTEKNFYYIIFLFSKVSVPGDIKDEYKNVAEEVTGENRTCVTIGGNGKTILGLPQKTCSCQVNLPVTKFQ